MHEWGGLTRFASSSIHQSTHREDTGVSVRVIKENRIGVASTNDFTIEGARRAADHAPRWRTSWRPTRCSPGSRRRPRSSGSTCTTRPRPRRRRRSAPTGSPTRRAVPGRVHGRGSVRDDRERGGGRQHRGAVLLVALDDGVDQHGRERRRGRPRVRRGVRAATSDVDPVAIGNAPRARPSTRSRRGTSRRGGIPSCSSPRRFDARGVPRVDRVRRAVARRGALVLLGQGGAAVAAGDVSIYDDARARGTLGLPFDFEACRGLASI